MTYPINIELIDDNDSEQTPIKPLNTVLVTGGAGYIGSHVCVELLNQHYDVIVIDNLATAYEEALHRVEKITHKSVTFYQGDIRDSVLLDRVFSEHKIDVVVHLAGLKSVGESFEKSGLYYDVNVNGTLAICKAMNKAGCHNIVFASSATVYGIPQELPLTESHRLNPMNPYGLSKVVGEEVLKDFNLLSKDFSVSIMRIFNPLGAHESGLLGEFPLVSTTNLLPIINKVVHGELPQLLIYGHDHDTHDGTCMRDFIHVMDVAKATVACCRQLIDEASALHYYNIGTGKGETVLDVVKNYKKVSRKSLPYHFEKEREGDIPVCYADISNTKEKLRWKPLYSLHHMCKDAWKFETKKGYSLITT